MLTYSDIKPGLFIEMQDEPYEVLDAHVFRKQKRKPVNQTRLRHIIHNNVIEHTFQQSDKVEEADIGNQSIIFIYKKHVPASRARQASNEYIFHTAGDTSNRFTLFGEAVGEAEAFLIEGMEVIGLTYDGDIVSVQLPIKVDLMVTEAPPNIKGNTAQGGTKRVTLESGAIVETPMFVDVGDIVRINTTTGKYDTRVSKKTTKTVR